MPLGGTITTTPCISEVGIYCSMPMADIYKNSNKAVVEISEIILSKRWVFKRDRSFIKICITKNTKDIYSMRRRFIR